MSLFEVGMDNFKKSNEFREQMLKEYREYQEKKEKKRLKCLHSFKIGKNGRCRNTNCGVFTLKKEIDWIKENGCDYFKVLESMGYEL
jgi:hypothetical protein